MNRYDKKYLSISDLYYAEYIPEPGIDRQVTAALFYRGGADDGLSGATAFGHH